MPRVRGKGKSSKKINPISSEDEAATKLQAVQRGNQSRADQAKAAAQQGDKTFEASVAADPTAHFAKMQRTIDKRKTPAPKKLPPLRSEKSVMEEQQEQEEMELAARSIQARIRGRQIRQAKKSKKGKWGRGFGALKAKNRAEKGMRLPWGGRLPIEAEIQLLLAKVKHEPATEKSQIVADSQIKTLCDYFKAQPAKLNATDESGRSVMHYVVMNIQTKLLRALMHEAKKYPELAPDPLCVHYGGDVRPEGSTPIQMACDVKDSGAVAVLLFHCINKKIWIRIPDLLTDRKSVV